MAFISVSSTTRKLLRTFLITTDRRALELPLSVHTHASSYRRLYNLSSSSGAISASSSTTSPSSSSSSSSSPRRELSSLRDAATRAVVNHAIDRMVAQSGQNATGDSVDLDALTWKSIVDRPVMADIDSISSTDLYPLNAPSIEALVRSSLPSSSSSSSSSNTENSSTTSNRVSASRGAQGVGFSSSNSNNNSTLNSSLHSQQNIQTTTLPDQVDESLDHLDLSAFPGAIHVDPFEVVAADLRGINGNIKAILGIDHPVLSTVAKYFFDWEGGKMVRPALVLLMAHAVNAHMTALSHQKQQQQVAGAGAGGGSGGAKEAASSSTTGSGGNNTKISMALGQLPAFTAEQLIAAQDLAAAGVASLVPEHLRKQLPAQVALPLQRRLAEITEMIHTASLLHDDVIDAADTRRGVSSVNTVFGNKLAVLAGDFLLARASVCLARLRNVPVVELLSTVIEHLVKGEVMQMKTALRSESACKAAFEMYLRKTYYKTGSLMANSCKAIALLGSYPDAVCTAAYKYGMHLGIAFQLVDDMLDFEGTSASLGKPALNDIRQGLATAPILFAAHRFPTLLPLIERKFSSPGDVDIALQAVTEVNGVALTRKLAIAHAQVALDSIAVLGDSPARTALAALASRVLNRTR